MLSSLVSMSYVRGRDAQEPHISRVPMFVLAPLLRRRLSRRAHIYAFPSSAYTAPACLGHEYEHAPGSLAFPFASAGVIGRMASGRAHPFCSPFVGSGMEGIFAGMKGLSVSELPAAIIGELKSDPGRGAVLASDPRRWARSFSSIYACRKSVHGQET